MERISPDILCALSPVQIGFIVSVRSTDPSSEGDALREIRVEMFSLTNLFGQEILDLPSEHIRLRKFLEGRGVTWPQLSSRRITQTLAHELYSEDEDRESTIQSASLIISHGRRVWVELSPTAPEPPQSQPQTFGASAVPSDRIAHNVAMGLKDSNSQFDGDLEECWREYVDSYFQIAKDYYLTSDQKLQYLHIVLWKDALRFYLNAVQPYTTTFQQAVAMIDREYNSPVRQNRVKNYLTSLRVKNFEENGMDISFSLSKM